MNDIEIINSVIKPFVVKKKYDQVPGDYYVSSSSRCIEIKPGLKIFYDNKEDCLKTSKELTDNGFKNRVGYNSDGKFWSIFILEDK